MSLVSSTMYKRIRLLSLVCFCFTSLSQAQTINSPYSRYGLGDIVPTQNILNRGMGGVSAAYYDFSSINYLNPASYARLQATTLDIGIELDNRSLRAINPPRKFTAYSPSISYLQLGFPLVKGKWGMNIGLNPITRISYKIERNERLPDIDSVNTLFEGTGGAYEAHIGTGLMPFKHLTIGLNIGYLFGSKDYSTRRSFVNDSVFYYKSNHETRTNYGGISLNGGIQYTIEIDKTSWLRLGAYGSLKREFNGTQDILRETFEYNSNSGGTDTVDVVFHDKDIKGKVTYPANFGAGFVFDKIGKWMIGVDYTKQSWSQYRFFGETEPVRDSWQWNIGGQILPKGGKNYWSNVAYRAGFTLGKDYITVDNDLPKWSVSMGIGLPMRKPAYTNQFSIINTTLEFGQRGDKSNLVRESFFRVAFGFSLSDIWFLKRKYD
jgi:hypothetical protein